MPRTDARATHTRSLHDALPISAGEPVGLRLPLQEAHEVVVGVVRRHEAGGDPAELRGQQARREVAEVAARSEEHTSELQSRENLVCRLLLEIKNNGPPSRAPEG